MPSNRAPCAALAAILLGACGFDASYAGGGLSCADGVCPAGQSCSAAHLCVAASDAGHADAPLDARADAAIDAALPHALTCADPGPLPAAGGSASDSTATRGNHVTALCAGVVHNAADAVYAIALPAATNLRVALAGTTGLDAYVIAPCAPAPATPACLGNAVATVGNPLLVTTGPAATYYVVVDSEVVAASGAFTVTVTRP